MNAGPNAINSVFELNSKTHDDAYIEYLNNTFGTTSIPLYGSILSVFAILLMGLLVIFNASLALINNKDYCKNQKMKQVPSTFTLPDNFITITKQ